MDEQPRKAEHTPVLLKEAVELLKVVPGGVYVDATLGLGGHALEILAGLAGSGLLIGLDRDSEALDRAREKLGWSSPDLQTEDRGSLKLRLFHEDYRNLSVLLQRLDIPAIDGILVDLGVSSIQLDTPSRGFSFLRSGPLDMRMDRRQDLTAERIVNTWSEDELSRLFRELGEEPLARRFAAEIVRRRRTRPFRLTDDLAEVLSQAGGSRHRRRIHPATKAFQALRIAVNRELEGLSLFLASCIPLLKTGGRIAVVSFHSLEDRLVKRVFQLEAGKCICRRPATLCQCPRTANVRILTRKPISPSGSETAKNPRARSAKLRAAERLDARLHEEQTTKTQYNNVSIASSQDCRAAQRRTANRDSRSRPRALLRIASSRGGCWTRSASAGRVPLSTLCCTIGGIKAGAS